MLALLSVLLADSVAEPLRSIEAIRALDVETANQGLPVDLESQVSWSDPLRKACFLYDGERGIYVRGKRPYDQSIELKPGDIVRVQGVTTAGGFSAAIYDAVYTRVGHRPLPEAKSYAGDRRMSTDLDCEWMELSARVVSMRIVRRDHPAERYIMVEMLRNNYLLNVQIPYTEASEQRLKHIMFEWVYVNVVAGTVFNSGRQAADRIFFASSADDFRRTITEEVRSRSGNKLKVSQFMQENINHLWIVNSEGTVTHVGNNELFLRGDSYGLKVVTLDLDRFNPGDRVYIEGLVVPGEISPEFRARESRILSKQAALEPRRIDADDLTNPGLNYDLVEIDAELVGVVRAYDSSTTDASAASDDVLLCQTGGLLFEVRLPSGIEFDPDWVVGSQLRLRGICHLVRDQDVHWQMNLTGLWLQPRGPSDITITQEAPWWTVGRVLWLMLVVLVLTAAFLIWILLLRRTVERQTQVIADQVEQKTLMNERQRMARELHDNLDQGLTGAAVHLQASRKYLDVHGKQRMEAIENIREQASAEMAERLEQHQAELEEDVKKTLSGLASVQAMLSHCGEESRRSILELRGGLLERMDLPSAIEESLRVMTEESPVRIQVSITGDARRLKQKVEHHLLMLAKEASNNALRHASPQSVQIGLDYTEGQIRLSVVDDGCGFERSKLSKAGHFGIRGMEERVNRLDGKIEIQSTVGEGTRIEVTLNALEQWEVN
ncbi:sensor histidine kinase [Coraliomargarita akajimensis]|uniref:sensor histidine kinase n=1 Tax=Coraliomargarita akajimensis TaxID=395922 RepID=UPI001C25FAAE|nr:sensor histidine kinase [Coraliomargarita akajimensis]